MRATIYFTALDGSEAEITGADAALEAIEKAFKKAGIKFNEQVETWDEGFYDTPKPKWKVTKSGSVECPHCHWGFSPSVIDQHIREKH